ncbi:uncharacterized protein [Watersipora subatra]|uniref:uncharacterized protein n=1 Tax=Watersipora subatra TaxID=2589382 RepID=UPI00355B3E6A
MELRRENGFCLPMGGRLFAAVKASRLAEVKILVLKSGLDVNSENRRRENCLIEALRIDDDKTRRAIFSFLFKSGCDVHHRDVSGRDALEWAAKLKREPECLRLLKGPMLEYDFLHRGSDGLTVLHHATINGMEQVVRAVAGRLRRYGISVDIPDSLQYTPYLHAKELQHKEIAKILAAAGASVHVERRSVSHMKKEEKKEGYDTQQLLQMNMHDRSPQLRRVLASRRYQSGSPSELQTKLRPRRPHDNGSSTFQLKSDSETSNSQATNSPDRSFRPESSKAMQTSMQDLQELFNVVSRQMTESFCKPAQKPNPETIILHKKTMKGTALAAIIAKQSLPTDAQPQKSPLTKKSSKTDVRIKPNYLTVLPAIKSAFSR